MTTELAINLLLATNVALAMAAFYCHWKWGIWQEVAKDAEGERNRIYQAHTRLAEQHAALMADAAERHRKLSVAGKKGRQVQLEKRRAA